MRRRPSVFLVLLVLLVLLAGLLFRPGSRGFAASPEESPALTPRLGEIESFFRAAAEPSGQAPLAEPQWAAAARKDIPSLTLRERVYTLRGLGKYDLDRPPVRHYWWNVPIYAALGFPRDLIDALAGAFQPVPFVNLILPGATYEVVPMQIFFRNWRDWHRWPGVVRNRNGHGWIDGEWGFFSNYRFTTFRKMDDARLALWRKHNAEVDQRIAAENAKVDADNALVRARRGEYLNQTRLLFANRQYRPAIALLLAYREVDPIQKDARGMLAAALIAVLHTLPERPWAVKTLNELLLSSSREVLLPVREELNKMAAAAPPNEDLYRYLVAINVRLDNDAQALEAAKTLVALNPANVTAARLRFEAALGSRNPEIVESAAREMESAAGKDSAAALHARGRQAMLAEQWDKAAGAYRRLASAEPANARFHYLLGLALVHEGRKTGLYDKRAALAELRVAEELASAPEEKALYRDACEAAALLRVKKP